MANSFTANLHLEKPEVGADSNLWGGHLNSDLDVLDSIFTSATTRPQSTIIKSDTKIVDATATSKAVLLVLSSITAATTRNLTVQDADGTLAYTAQIATSTAGFATTGQVAAATSTTVIMDLTSVQTATNKTLTAPLLTGILAASTGVTATAASNNTQLATNAYADRIALQQIVTTQTGAFTSAATQTPADDTIPQIGEGTEYMTLAITPKSATSTLLIDVVFNYGLVSVVSPVIALFQDATANALKAIVGTTEALGQSISFRHVMTSGTTSSTTFRVRAGTNDGSTLYFNGTGGARRLGGIMASSIIITEIGI